MELTITISALAIIFFLLFCFIKILKIPLTLILAPFVTAGILKGFITGLPDVVALIIGVVVSISFLVVHIIKNKRSAMPTTSFIRSVFGFCLLYLSFMHLAVFVDSIMYLFGQDNVLISKLINNELPVDTLILEVSVAFLFGLILRFTPETFCTTCISFIGSFMIVLFAIDAFSGNTNYAILFSTENFNFNIISYMDNINLKNIELYSKTVNDPDFLHTYVALGFAIPITICSTILSRRENDIF